MWRYVLLACATALLANSAEAQPCTDVKHLDPRNATMRIGGHTDGGSGAEYSISLHNGVDFLSDDPASPDAHDWKVDLISDRVEHPDPATWTRVIVLDRNHLTGTGNWRYILVFGCDKGSLVLLFQYAAEGVTLEHTHGPTLRLYQAEWKTSDAHCCPSQHAELVYEWDVDGHRYRRKESIRGDGFAPNKDEK